MTPVAEVVAADFATVRAAARPAVLRGLAAGWPLVHAADPIAYLRRFPGGEPVGAVRAPAAVGGRFHYNADLTGFNFERARLPVAAFLDALAAAAGSAAPPAMAVQSAMVAAALPGLERALPMPLLPDAAPRIWIGNALKVATHADPMENVAVAAVGRRRVTLFPPAAVGDLYIGPLELTPAGAPISMVHVTAPDLDRYPRYAAALKVAQTVDLAPGDALYIPYHWWHHVESLDAVSVLVNYWWNPARSDAGSPWDALLFAMWSLRTLPSDQRAAWRTVFDHYVFQTGPDPAAHLPGHAQGILAPLTPQGSNEVRAMLKELLARL